MLKPIKRKDMSEDLKRHNDEHERASLGTMEQLAAVGIDPGTLTWLGVTASDIIKELTQLTTKSCVVDVQNATSDLTIKHKGTFGGSATFWNIAFLSRVCRLWSRRLVVLIEVMAFAQVPGES